MKPFVYFSAVHPNQREGDLLPSLSLPVRRSTNCQELLTRFSQKSQLVTGRNNTYLAETFSYNSYKDDLSGKPDYA